MKDQLLETWDIHNRINLYLLDSMEENCLQDVSASKGRTIGAQLAHMHNVRLMWLKAASPELAMQLTKKLDSVSGSGACDNCPDMGRQLNVSTQQSNL